MGETAVILTIGKQERNLTLLAEMLRETGYGVEIATTLAEFDSFIDARDDIALAILDVTGFSDDIWTRCEQLHTRAIPALILTTRINARIRERAMSHGINTLLEKPVRKTDLAASVRGMISYAEQTT